MTRLLGAHMSIAGGIDQSVDRGRSIGCTAIQIFVKNNNQWLGKPLADDEVERFKQKRAVSGIFVFAHTGYLINLASPKTEIYRQSVNSLLDEIGRCTVLNIPYLVLHPGAHLGEGVEAGTARIASSLNLVIKKTESSPVKILLETTAGQGSSIGRNFGEIKNILEQIENQERIGVCADTCHLFAAGYNLGSKEGYKKTWEEFERIIGFEKLLAFHLNDSKGGLGEKKDRHEHIGKGKLGLNCFRFLLNDQRFENLPMVLETPKDAEMEFDRENLRILNGLIS